MTANLVTPARDTSRRSANQRSSRSRPTRVRHLTACVGGSCGLSPRPRSRSRRVTNLAAAKRGAIAGTGSELGIPLGPRPRTLCHPPPMETERRTDGTTAQVRGSRTRRAARILGAALGLVGAAMLLSSCQPARLAGTIRVPGTGAPAAGVEIALYQDDVEVLVAQTWADATGAYTFPLDAFPAGTYRVRLSDDTWWSKGRTWSEAASVDLSADSTSLDFEVVP